MSWQTTQVLLAQIGDDMPVKLVASTLREMEQVLPLLKELQAKDREVNILYGFPLYEAAVGRLAQVARQLAPFSVSVLVDYPSQVDLAVQLARAAGTDITVFVKIDVGSQRAGVVPGSPTFLSLAQAVCEAHYTPGNGVLLHGFYSHAGHAYDARSPAAAMDHLAKEFQALAAAARALHAVATRVCGQDMPLDVVLSAGASPTVASIHNEQASKALWAARDRLTDVVGGALEIGCKPELHAGVQPLMDLQQLATHAWGGFGPDHREIDDLALTVLADVASVYPGRGPNGTDEFLINAGCLALARESVKGIRPPCASADTGTGGRTYAGWGIVMPWTDDGGLVAPGAGFPALPPADGSAGWWQVSRLSQEHGILTWAGGQPPKASQKPKVGQRLRIWPNHACITAASYGFYLVVNGDSAEPDKVVDVWERQNGWV